MHAGAKGSVIHRSLQHRRKLRARRPWGHVRNWRRSEAVKIASREEGSVSGDGRGFSTARRGSRTATRQADVSAISTAKKHMHSGTKGKNVTNEHVSKADGRNASNATKVTANATETRGSDPTATKHLRNATERNGSVTSARGSANNTTRDQNATARVSKSNSTGSSNATNHKRSATEKQRSRFKGNGTSNASEHTQRVTKKNGSTNGKESLNGTRKHHNVSDRLGSRANASNTSNSASHHEPATTKRGSADGGAASNATSYKGEADESEASRVEGSDVSKVTQRDRHASRKRSSRASDTATSNATSSRSAPERRRSEIKTSGSSNRTSHRSSQTAKQTQEVKSIGIADASSGASKGNEAPRGSAVQPKLRPASELFTLVSSGHICAGMVQAGKAKAQTKKNLDLCAELCAHDSLCLHFSFTPGIEGNCIWWGKPTCDLQPVPHATTETWRKLLPAPEGFTEYAAGSFCYGLPAVGGFFEDATLEKCATRCLDAVRCNYVSYYGSPPRCYLVERATCLPKPVEDARADTFKKVVKPINGFSLLAEGADCAEMGREELDPHVTTLGPCALACGKSPECSFFAFYEETGACFRLENRSCTRRFSPLPTAKVWKKVRELQGRAQGAFSLVGVGRRCATGQHANTLPADTVDICGAACASDEACQGFSYSGVALECSRRYEPCPLVEDAPGDVDMWARTTPSKPASNYALVGRGKYCAGKGNYAGKQSSVEKCTELCTKDGRCSHVSYYSRDRTCYLHRSLACQFIVSLRSDVSTFKNELFVGKPSALSAEVTLLGTKHTVQECHEEQQCCRNGAAVSKALCVWKKTVRTYTDGTRKENCHPAEPSVQDIKGDSDKCDLNKCVDGWLC